MSKGYVYFWVFIGSTIGSYIPVLFHQSFLSISSIIFGMLGGLAGVWAAIKTKDIFF